MVDVVHQYLRTGFQISARVVQASHDHSVVLIESMPTRQFVTHADVMRNTHRFLEQILVLLRHVNELVDVTQTTETTLPLLDVSTHTRRQFNLHSRMQWCIDGIVVVLPA